MSEAKGMVTIAHPNGTTIEVAAEGVLHFNEALWGFPDRLDYVLLPAARVGLWWMISVGEPTVTFVLADPFVVKPEYALDLADAEQQALQLTSPNDAFALVMVTLPHTTSEPITANFRAPLVFNLNAGRAAQIVARDEQYSLREAFDLTAYPLQEAGVTLE